MVETAQPHLQMTAQAVVAALRLLALREHQLQAATAATVRLRQYPARLQLMLVAVAAQLIKAAHPAAAARAVAATLAQLVAIIPVLLAQPIPAAGAVEGTIKQVSLQAAQAALASSSSNTLSPSNLS